jgi:hypothetical protein
MKEAGDFAGLFVYGFLQRAAFIDRSSNKLYGTYETAEHRPSPFVVGRAVQTREERFQ